MQATLKASLVAAMLTLVPLIAAAQSPHHHDHGSHDRPAHATGEPRSDTGPSSTAYRAANAKMHAGMDIAFTGDADVDFIRGMIPHHQGAVEMAKTVLTYGKDPQIRKLAEDIVKAQESEIALMRAWLKQNAR